MARDIETLTLQMSADIRRFEKSMAALRATADRRLNEVERRTLQADRNLSRASGQIAGNMVRQFREGLRGLAPVLAGAFSAAQVIRYADSYTNLQNRLRAAGLEGERLVTVENALYDAANRNGVAVDAVTQLFQRASLARDQLGATDQQLIDLTNGVTAALRVQGVSAAQASGPLLQLGQALGAGTVRAEELNSLLEGTPVLLQAAARGSDRFQGNLNALASAIREGTVTSQELFAALLAGLPELERQASSMPLTVGQALQSLNDQLGRFVGQTDSGLSATQRMAQGIELLANNLDLVVTAGGVAVTLVGGRMVLAFSAATIEGLRYQATLLSMAAAQANVSRTALLATTALGGLRTAAMFFLTNPIGIAITAVAAALALVALNARQATPPTEDLRRSLSALERATQAYTDAAAAAATATGQGARAAREAAADARALAVAEREAAMAKLAVAQATVAQIEAEARRQLDLERQAPIRGDRPGSIRTIGREARAELRQARADAEAASEAIRRAQEAITQADQLLARPPAPASPEGEDRRRRRSGPTPEELAAMRARIRLEMDLEVARARGDQAAIRALEERLELMRLADELQRAEVANAEEEARAHLARRNAATQAADAERLARENAVLTQRLQAEAAEDNARWAERQLAVQIDMARLAGDWTMVRRLEREADLHRRIAEYVERYGIAGYGMAIAEQGMADEAETEGRIRREMRGAAGAFLDALREGDMGSFFDAMGRRFADAAADSLTDVLMNIIKSMRSGEGGGWFQSLGNAIGRWFGGGRASGGPVQAGKAYIVGEKRPELFIPGRSGTIVPQVPAGGVGELKVEVHNHGAAARAEVTRTAEGARVDLRPMLRDGLKAMGAEGTLARAARQSPQPKRRG